jgi:hypothetical protein
MPTLAVHLLRVSRVLILAALFGGWLQSASGQTEALPDPAISLRTRLDPTTQVAVQAVIDSAAANGLPTRPLVSKALEGSAKGAPATRILAAVRSLSVDLAVARNALGAEAEEDALVAGVGALRVGAAAAYLRELRETRRVSSTAWPLAVLADLVSSGVPVDTAAGVVLGLARAGVMDAAYTQLEEEVRQDVSAGVPPGTSAAARAASAGGRLGPASGPVFQLPPRPARPDAGRRP